MAIATVVRSIAENCHGDVLTAGRTPRDTARPALDKIDETRFVALLKENVAFFTGLLDEQLLAIRDRFVAGAIEKTRLFQSFSVVVFRQESGCSLIGVAFALQKTFGTAPDVEGEAFIPVVRDFARLRGLNLEAAGSPTDGPAFSPARLRENFFGRAEMLRLPADRIWFAGTDVRDEILPAAASGMRTIWINRDGETFPPASRPPDATVTAFAEILDVLSEPYTRGLLELRHILKTAMDWRPGHFISEDDTLVLEEHARGEDES